MTLMWVRWWGGEAKNKHTKLIFCLKFTDHFANKVAHPSRQQSHRVVLLEQSGVKPWAMEPSRYTNRATYPSSLTSGNDLFNEIMSLAIRLNWFILNISFILSCLSGDITTAFPCSPGQSGGFCFGLATGGRGLNCGFSSECTTARWKGEKREVV